MNYWVQKSINIANSPGYLDKLTEIYPATLTQRAPLPPLIKQKIIELIDGKRFLEAISLLVSLTEWPFPIEHPYVSLLRAKPQLLEQNPKVVQQIGQILASLGPEGVIKGCERPPDLNRQMGPRFRDWLRKHFAAKGYAFLSEYAFGSHKGKAFLDAGDTAITRYANAYLGCKIARGRDFLAKVGNKYVIGEARFLSSGGGSQSRDVRETAGFVKDRIGDVIKIGVLDGMPWFEKDMRSVIQTFKDDETGLSALLLEEFLENLG